jgi:RNA polymerase sigma-70 factor, ECF subfamily
MRDAGQEVSLHHGGLPAASTHSLANLLLGRLTSPPQAAIRAERQLRLQEALNGMDELDREILALRGVEQHRSRHGARPQQNSRQQSLHPGSQAAQRDLADLPD